MSEIPVIPLVSIADAFQVFATYVENGISDFEGRNIEADFGDYTHVIRNEERVKRVSWIAQTAKEPDEVWRSRSKNPERDNFISGGKLTSSGYVPKKKNLQSYSFWEWNCCPQVS